MIYEIAELEVDPDDRDGYVQRYEQAWKTAAFSGGHALKLLKCAHCRGRVVSLIQWDSVEAHLRLSTDPNKIPFRQTVHTGLKKAIVLHYEYEEIG